jgi:predicted O-linked N-acetylglucosamine transferase (SPINDLY family)
MRLAPVQAASWGHPETSGLPTIDYYLSARAIEPPDAQQHYTETLVLLPGTGCWLPRGAEEARDVDWAGPGHSSRQRAHGLPRRDLQVRAEHDALLVEIARRVPHGKLLLFRSKPPALSERLERRLRAAFDRAQVSYERHVVFLPWQDAPAFRALLAGADLYLDSVGFSGFNTALQAVRCGLPVITRDGRFMRGRLAAGILREMAMDELVAPTDAAYVELAAALANDPRRRRELRERIARSRERLFEDEAPVRALEDFLERVTQP